jgi:hypothetical protein
VGLAVTAFVGNHAQTSTHVLAWTRVQEAHS